jgi:hypothetical protein
MIKKNQIGGIEQRKDGYFFRASAIDFKNLPGAPISYWASANMLRAFVQNSPLHTIATPRAGMITGNNGKFVRFAHEVERGNIFFTSQSRVEAKNSQKRWFPYQKGGPFRKYYGNMEYVVNWENDGNLLRTTKDSRGKVPAHAFNEDYIFKANVNWSAVTAGSFSSRITVSGCLFDASGSAAFPSDPEQVFVISAFLNSPIAREMISFINPTLNFQAWEIGSLPLLDSYSSNLTGLVQRTQSLRRLAKDDWDSGETSWDFTSLPLLRPGYRQPALKVNYQQLRTDWRDMTLEMQCLEQENNRIFIDAYGLQDELTPAVPLKEVTLTCNPHYRYGGDKTEEELEALLLADTMRELVSYAVGCMFGRYSLDKPGLILANQGETLADYLAQVPQPTFAADEDNVIPMLDGEWFADDVTERFRQFLRVTFGDEHYDENLAFIEQALNIKGKRNYTLRDYMLGEFYADHVKRYKKRPIYWLFSSPKGTFNALIYLHRYRPDTASVVLRYLRDFRAKLAARQSMLEQVLINPATSQGEKTRANKEIDTLKKQIIELQDYENDTLYPLATANVALDLDDGVKVNYLKLGAALKKIPGLDAKEED